MEIRDSEINVIATLNIQHVVGLNGVVNEVTGISLRETASNCVLDTREGIELLVLNPNGPINHTISKYKIGLWTSIPARMFFRQFCPTPASIRQAVLVQKSTAKMLRYLA